jgi:hypothetical protein
LPIEFDNELNLYKASCGFYFGKESTEKWYKRWDDKNTAYVDTKNKIMTGRGKYKNYAMPIKICHANKITFFAKADKKEMQRLLDKHIYSLGKKNSQGYGIVRKWVITEIDRDNSFVFKNGNLSRQIPLASSSLLIKNGNINLNTKQSQNCTYIFPYWDISKRVECFVPKVKFRSEEEFITYIL